MIAKCLAIYAAVAGWRAWSDAAARPSERLPAGWRIVRAALWPLGIKPRRRPSFSS